MFALSGCASLRQTSDTPPPAATAAPAQKTKTQTAVATPVPKPQKPRKPAAPPSTAPAQVEKPASLPPAPPLRPVGMDEESLKTLLGTPASSRDEAPAKVISFRRSECALNLTLYPDVETRVFRALSYEVTSDVRDERAARLCESRFGISADDGMGVAARK